MKWVIIKGVRYPMSVVSAFAAYYGNNPFLKIRIRSKYHIISFDNFDCLNIQIRYLTKMRYVRSFIITSMRVSFIMRMGKRMPVH